MNKPENESELLDRISGLELKVNLLLGMVAVQLACLLVSWVTGLFGKTFWILTMLIVIGAVGYVFRGQIPNWSGQLIRYAFQGRTDGKSEDKIL